MFSELQFDCTNSNSTSGELYRKTYEFTAYISASTITEFVKQNIQLPVIRMQIVMNSKKHAYTRNSRIGLSKIIPVTTV